ncbi:hypothetical protein N7513_006643 [Penicillium frequentans]|nr:hypothetical protein N7513_006643 [Penicillium glabrum]
MDHQNEALEHVGRHVAYERNALRGYQFAGNQPSHGAATNATLPALPRNGYHALNLVVYAATKLLDQVPWELQVAR